MEVSAPDSSNRSISLIISLIVQTELLCAAAGGFYVPLERATHPVGCHCSNAILLPWHRGASASTQSLTLLRVRMAVVASAERGVICRQFEFCLLSVGGGTLLERAGPGVWVGTLVPPTVLLAMVTPLGPPLTSALPEDSSQGLVKGKNPSRFLFS